MSAWPDLSGRQMRLRVAERTGRPASDHPAATLATSGQHHRGHNTKLGEIADLSGDNRSDDLWSIQPDQVIFDVISILDLITLKVKVDMIIRNPMIFDLIILIG